VNYEELFTSEELEEMGKPTVELLEHSIDIDDREKAKKLNKRLYREFLSLHDMYRDWITALLSFIGRRYGDQALNEALEESVNAWLVPISKRYAGKSKKQQAEMLIAGLRAHLCPMEIEEDEEKFIITLHPCGSGGRQMLDGAYEPPHGFLKVKDPQAMTFNRADFPVYCCHCYFQSQPQEMDGKPLFITEPAEKLGEEPCHVYLYK
jgi:hypothetical protein